MLLCHFKFLVDAPREANERPPLLQKISARNIADGMEIATPNQQEIVLYVHQEDRGTQESQPLWWVTADEQSEPGTSVEGGQRSPDAERSADSSSLVMSHSF